MSETSRNLIKDEQPALLQFFKYRIFGRRNTFLDLLDLLPNIVIPFQEITELCVR